MTIEWPYMMETITVCDALDAGKCLKGVVEYVERNDKRISGSSDVANADVRFVSRRDGSGDGYGYGYGYGSGDGYGYGSGYGYGYGYGYGDGYGSGDGSGYGSGSGDGYGDGDGGGRYME